MTSRRDDQIHIRLSTDLKNWLRKEAAKDDRSIQYLIVKILEDWRGELRRKEQKQ